MELGVKLSADTSGTVTGIRFYKAATNTGTHVGSLWTSDGTLLARATFANETASGWQQADFPNPVPIAAGTVYIASYHTGTGHYSVDAGYFAGRTLDSPPLHAPADGTFGPNGVYVYSPTPAFPSQGWNGTNYWVDVVFTPGASGTPGTGDSVAPAIGAFTIPATSATLTVPILAFAATDNIGVSGYLVNELASPPPSPAAAGWSAAVPASYTFGSAGSKTLYAWAKDAAGNVSASRSAPVAVTVQTTGLLPPGWYAGDIHVHRSCGGPPVSVSSVYNAMAANDLAVVSLLADMGNGEVQDATLDLPKVNGQDDPISTAGRIVHWDAEWHWDATYFEFPYQALGGHVLALGLSEAHQIWEEYTYPIFEWAHSQGAIAGFAHMQYLGDGIPETLNCCLPMEYPVEVALGTADFISEDVQGSDSAIDAYYRLLNSGFRPGLAAGSDYPCGAELGSLLTYSRIPSGQLTYRDWIEGIAAGRTVVSRNGRSEFLDLQVNGSAGPGDEIPLAGGGNVQATVVWTADRSLSGTIELVHNGVVVASRQASVTSQSPASLSATLSFSKSGWLAARRMGNNGHQVHTAAVFVMVDAMPVRASAEDADFFVRWIDNLLEKTSPGGAWSSYFTQSRDNAQARYRAARSIYAQIASEASGDRSLAVTSVAPVNGATNVPTAAAVTATFSRAMSPQTIGEDTFSLRDASGTPVPAQVTYDIATRTATLAPLVPLAFTTSYTATVKGGASGVTDPSGNPLASDFIWLFATGSDEGGAYSLWSRSANPSILADSDTGAVELGVKFRTQAPGQVTGLLFYKSAVNTGIHLGNLWSSGGDLLANVVFSNETPSGWQYQPLPTPVAILADTTYIASYHTTVGRYSSDPGYFSGSGVDNGVIRALQDGESGPNGVYRYGSTSGFPSESWNASNYWVDIEFRP